MGEGAGRGGVSLKVVAFIDDFSRFPLAFRVFWEEPTAEEVCGVLDAAFSRFGQPKLFVTDQGAQFTAGSFRDSLRDRGIKHRFGALGKTGSIAIIERPSKTMTETLGLGIGFQPLGPRHLSEKLDLFFFHYATISPHQSFRGATPAEKYFGIEPAVARARPAPRKQARGADPPEPLPIRVGFLDDARRLPVVLDDSKPERIAA